MGLSLASAQVLCPAVHISGRDQLAPTVCHFGKCSGVWCFKRIELDGFRSDGVGCGLGCRGVCTMDILSLVFSLIKGISSFKLANG
jgi:hypothetical protein